MPPTRNDARRGVPGRRDLQQTRHGLSLLWASTVLAAAPAALLGTLTAAPSSAQAQTAWTGVVSSDWFTAGNWSAGLPGPAQDVELNTVTPSPTVINAPGAAAQNLTVGVDSVGQLAIMGGGTVTNGGFALVGALAGSQGRVTVTGPGSAWTSNDYLSVGEGGTGHLTIANGGAVTASTGYLGYAAGSQGTATVTGPGSTWANSNELWVGDSGTGQLTIANGGAVTAYQGYIGQTAGSRGTVIVTGFGSTWTNSDVLTVGGSGNGQLTVADGGAVSSTDGIIGAFPDSRGTATVTGAGSSWTNSGLLVAGMVGNGQLTVANGGTVSSSYGILGFYPGSQGSVTVTGPGSAWTNNDFVLVGIEGGGQLTIADGGQVNAATLIGIAMLPGSTGALSIGAPSGQPAAAPGTLNSPSVLFGDGAGALTFNHTGTAYTFAAEIFGHGAVNVLSGTTILTATNTYSGPTVVSGGSLVVNGAIASSVTLNGGTLGGSGTVGGILAQGGGTVAPGNSIGTLNVAGNVAFSSGSTYQVEVNAAGQGDRIAATGNATLTGGTVQVMAQTGSYQLLTNYTILSASGGVSGQFANVTSNLAFLSPALFYLPNSVTLQLTRNTLDFAAIASTRNQFATGGGVESLGFGNRVYDAILFSTAPDARAAFDQLSGEIYASGQTAAVETSHLVREAALNRLRSLGGLSPTGATAMVPAAYAADLAGRTAADAAVPLRSFDPRLFTLWAQGVGNWGRTDGNGNAAGLDRSTGGILLGAEATIDERWRFGFAGGYTHTRLEVKERLSSGDLNSVHGVLYGGASLGALQLRTGVAFSHNDYEIHRRITIASLGDATQASYGGSTLQAFGEVGYRFGFGIAMVEPFIGAAAIRVSADRFAETGGATVLTGSARDLDLGTTTLGVRGEVALGSASPFILRGLLGWRHAFGDVTPTALLAFRSGGIGFAVAGVPIDRNSLVAEAGVDWRISDQVIVSLNYIGAIGSQAQDHGVKGAIAVRF
jgi:outer membrane autotransporter protein